MEKQDPRGIFVLCEGEVKLTISSSEGKTLILRIAKPGEILGLMAAISGKPYEVTAETLRPSQIAFVRRDDFLRFVAQYPEASHGISNNSAPITTALASSCEPSAFQRPPLKSSRSCSWNGPPDAEHTKLGTQITIAFDARGNRGIHRQHTRDGHAHVKRIPEPPPRHDQRFYVVDSEPRGARTICKCLASLCKT